MWKEDLITGTMSITAIMTGTTGITTGMGITVISFSRSPRGLLFYTPFVSDRSRPVARDGCHTALSRRLTGMAA